MMTDFSQIQICFIVCLVQTLVVRDVCTQALPEYTFSLPSPANEAIERHSLIRNYFEQGFSYLEIVATLLIVHGISISLRHLKRLLSRLGLRRRVLQNDESPLHLLVTAILQELQNSGQCIGYRTMWKRLVYDHRLRVKRDTVLQLLRVIDPEGVERRKRHRLLRRRYIAPGPNFIWHVDGYDKLKPFGFAIHGAIDGFSRRILWLEVSSTNNDPTVVASYYLDCVKQLGQVPRVLRCDLGTENTNLEFVQPFFRSGCNDNFAGLKSFMHGKSTANQRIEAWWGILRKQCTDWWINIFKDFRDRGIYNNHDSVHVECLRFCFMDILQRELHKAAKDWNTHTIRSNRNAECPTGKPDVMYFTPLLYDARNYGTPIETEDVRICRELYGKNPPRGYSDELEALVQLLRPGLLIPTTADEAIELYTSLIQEIDNR